MFYADNIDKSLRLGDIVKGFVSAVSEIKKPIVDIKDHSYTVKLNLPVYSVIMTPCCSIGDKTVSIAPLLPINLNFLKNPYFVEDMTRINHTMLPQRTMSDEVWNGLPYEEKQKRLAEDNVYALVEYFVFEKHDCLPLYPISKAADAEQINYYMIDFRMINQITCDLITKASQSLGTTGIDKVLQLSIDARDDLRKKLTNYYSRKPDEDIILAD